MKKNKLSNVPSENTSPVPYRKSYNDVVDRPNLFASDPDIASTAKQHQIPDALSKSVHLPGTNINAARNSAIFSNDYETIDKRRNRNDSYDTKDPGYETIPACKSSSSSNDRGSTTETGGIRSSAPAGISFVT